jgi:hypothetical protein
MAPGAAHAAGTSTTVVSRVGVPSPLAFSTAGTASCATASAATVKHVKGPKKPPLGKGSLRLSLHPNSTAAVSEAPSGENLTDLTQMSLSSYKTAASAAVDQVLIISAPTSPSDDYYQVTLALPTTEKTWAATDVLGNGTLVTAKLIDPSDGSVVTTDNTSYQAFASGHPALGLQSVGIDSTNCTNSTHVLDIDALTIGFSDTATTYDFEAAVGTKLVGRISAASIVAGKTVTPRATLSAGGHPFAGQPVTLYQKPIRAKHFNKVKTVTTNAKGVAKASRKPRISTAYQWRFGGSATYQAAVSATHKVAVARRLTLRLEQAKVRSGVPLDGSGTLSPKHPGAIVKLWERKRHGKVRALIAKGAVHHDGSYSIARNLPVGSYKIFATVAATKTNTSGKSPTRSFVVTGP